MNDIIFNIVESKFEIKSTHSYDLSVLIGTDRFFYAIGHEGMMLFLRIYAIPTYQTPIERLSTLTELLSEDRILSRTFKSTRICMTNKEFTLIPDELFQEESAGEIFRNTNHLPEDTLLAINTLSDNNLKVLFSISQNQHGIFERYLPDFQLFHISTALVAYSNHILSKEPCEEYMMININQAVFQAVVFKNHKFVFYNQYDFDSPESFIYFVVLILDKVGLNQNEVKLHITGEIFEESPLIHKIKTYIKQVKFMNQPKHLDFGERFDLIPSHFYSDIYSLNLCE